jgi:hypothetical protein
MWGGAAAVEFIHASFVVALTGLWVAKTSDPLWTVDRCACVVDDLATSMAFIC